MFWYTSYKLVQGRESRGGLIGKIGCRRSIQRFTSTDLPMYARGLVRLDRLGKVYQPKWVIRHA